MTGLVTDQTGAVVPGAPVKLTNSATGEVRTTTTTDAGTYRFPALQVVGTYSLEVAPKGFKTERCKTSSSRWARSNARRQDGSGHGERAGTVEAGAQLVQTEDASLSQNVDGASGRTCRSKIAVRTQFIGLVRRRGARGQRDVDYRPRCRRQRNSSGTGNFMVEGFSNNDQGLGERRIHGTGPGGATRPSRPMLFRNTV